MKRKFIFIVLIIMISICTCSAYANDSEEPAEDPSNMDYVEANIVTASLIIKDGEAICKTEVNVFNSSSANKMVVTVKYIKHNVGTIATKTATVYRSGVSFIAKTKKALTSSGTYHCKVTIKLYNGSTLLETINVLTNSVTY